MESEFVGDVVDVTMFGVAFNSLSSCRNIAVVAYVGGEVGGEALEVKSIFSGVGRWMGTCC